MMFKDVFNRNLYYYISIIYVMYRLVDPKLYHQKDEAGQSQRIHDFGNPKAFLWLMSETVHDLKFSRYILVKLTIQPRPTAAPRWKPVRPPQKAEPGMVMDFWRQEYIKTIDILEYT